MLSRLLVPLTSPEAADAARFGPKAANLAALGHAGLPIPDGVCLDAAAYRLQLEALGLEASARGALPSEDHAEARRHALRMKLELLEQPNSYLRANGYAVAAAAIALLSWPLIRWQRGAAHQ